MSECVFCLIADKKASAKIFYEDKALMAIQDINPKAEVHVLIIPKKHINSVNELEKGDAKLIGQMFLLAKDLARQFNISTAGYKLVANCGRGAGQMVDHLHLHLLAGHDLRSLV